MIMKRSFVGFALSSLGGLALIGCFGRGNEVASTTTVTFTPGYSSRNAETASLSCSRLGCERPSVAMFDPSTTKRLGLSFCVVMS